MPSPPRSALARTRTASTTRPSCPRSSAAGYDRSFEQLALRGARPPLRPRRVARRCARSSSTPRHSAYACPTGRAIDLGGIGKGYSATRAVRAMRGAGPGIRGALVDLGGDIAVDGGSRPRGAAWRVGIADPREAGAQLGVLALARRRRRHLRPRSAALRARTRACTT